MIPLQKVKDIILRHDALEKDLSSANIEPKLLAKKSKEYSNLGNIISIAKEYINCLLYTSPSPRDRTRSRMPSSA